MCGSFNDAVNSSDYVLSGNMIANMKLDRKWKAAVTCLIWSTDLAHGQPDWRKPLHLRREEIRTGHIRNITEKHYRLSQLVVTSQYDYSERGNPCDTCAEYFMGDWNGFFHLKTLPCHARELREKNSTWGWMGARHNLGETPKRKISSAAGNRIPFVQICTRLLWRLWTTKCNTATPTE